MHCPADAIECGPLVNPAVRIEQLVRIQLDREGGRADFREDEWTWPVRDGGQALFLLARGHRPVRVIQGIPRMVKEVWFFWLAAQGELNFYWAAARTCAGFRRRESPGRPVERATDYLGRIRAFQAGSR